MCFFVIDWKQDLNFFIIKHIRGGRQMIRLIATDMDGTFLDSQKKFDKSFIDLFYQMKVCYSEWKSILSLISKIFTS